MSDGILKELLKLEQEIEADLSREQLRAEAWLARVCQSIDQDLDCAQNEESLTSEQQISESIRTARKAASERLRHERRRAKTLTELSSDTLLPLLATPLEQIYRGREHDCSDDKS